MSSRLRNTLLSVLLFAVLAMGLWSRLDRLAKEQRAKEAAPFLTLGALAKKLATEKQTFDRVLDTLGLSRGLVTELQLAAMRKAFAVGDFSALDEQPQVTLGQLREGLGLLGTQRGYTDPNPVRDGGFSTLGLPTGQSGPTAEPYLADIGLGLKRGDRLNSQKAKYGADSERLAQQLEVLALGAGSVEDVTSPEALLERLRERGATVEVLDERLAANFGDLEHEGKAVATPLWVATGRFDKEGRPLLLPVPHAQLVLVVSGPFDARVTFYPALDLAGTGGGGLHFRADVTADQPWCGGRVVHRYRQEQALEAVRLMAALRRAYDEKVRAAKLPLDGYFALGVCTLAPALVEQALTKKTSLWPLTHDPAHFTGESEVDRLVRALPADAHQAPPPDDERVRGSLPWEPNAVVLPSLRARLEAMGLSK